MQFIRFSSTTIPESYNTTTCISKVFTPTNVQPTETKVQGKFGITNLSIGMAYGNLCLLPLNIQYASAPQIFPKKVTDTEKMSLSYLLRTPSKKTVTGGTCASETAMVHNSKIHIRANQEYLQNLTPDNHQLFVAARNS